MQVGWQEWEAGAEPGDAFSSLLIFVTSPEEAQGCHRWLSRYPHRLYWEKECLVTIYGEKNQEDRISLSPVPPLVKFYTVSLSSSPSPACCGPMEYQYVPWHSLQVWWEETKTPGMWLVSATERLMRDI